METQSVNMILTTLDSALRDIVTCLAAMKSSNARSKTLAKIPIIRGIVEGLCHFLNCTKFNNPIKSTQALMTDLGKKGIEERDTAKIDIKEKHPTSEIEMGCRYERD